MTCWILVLNEHTSSSWSPPPLSEKLSYQNFGSIPKPNLFFCYPNKCILQISNTLQFFFSEVVFIYYRWVDAYIKLNLSLILKLFILKEKIKIDWRCCNGLFEKKKRYIMLYLLHKTCVIVWFISTKKNCKPNCFRLYKLFYLRVLKILSIDHFVHSSFFDSVLRDSINDFKICYYDLTFPHIRTLRINKQKEFTWTGFRKVHVIIVMRVTSAQNLRNICSYSILADYN